MSTRPDRFSSVDPQALTTRERDEYVRPSSLAAEWNVHVRTVYRDIRKGALPAFRLPSGSIRIRREDARRYGRPVE